MKKKIIVLMIILLIILIVIVGVILHKYKNIGKTEYGIDEVGQEPIYEVNRTLQPVKIRNNFYIVKTCVNKFYTYCMESDSTEKEQKNDEGVIYNLLDKEYISFKNIKKENLVKIIPQIKESVINITNMSVSTQSADIAIYFTEGTLREKVSGKISEFKIMIKIDAKTRTFSIYLQDYLDEKYKELNIGTEIVIENLNNIEENINNTYDYKSISDEIYVTDLFNKYKEEILYNTELAYKHLHEEYKGLRFATIEQFQEYAKDNIVNNVTAKLEQYNKKVTDEYTQYICIDKTGKYYIFRENSVMDYDLILDTYTIELPEVVESYNNLTSMEKAGYNVQICIEAINNKDYSYVYNKLDTEFKNNNYKTKESFIKTIKNNLFDNNKVEEVSSLNEGNTYIYKLNIIDADNSNKTKHMTFIMQLKGGTDFVMSFSFE